MSTAPPLGPAKQPLPDPNRQDALERLSQEVLRLADGLHIPIPVDTIWRYPPGHLWPAPSQELQWTLNEDPANPYLPRVQTAREVAMFVNASVWETKQLLLGTTPMSETERTYFALALLMPATLVTTLSKRQREPAMVSRIFQVPQDFAVERLSALGYS